MCDCYYHKCKDCEKEIPIHLGDFVTRRDEIEVFCNDHIPDKDVRVFIMRKPEKDEIVGRFPKGYMIGIRDITEKAINNASEKSHALQRSG